LIRVYFWLIGSYHIRSLVEKPITRSMCVGAMLDWLMSWHSACALEKRILVKLSA
jgi:hypothetical protein